MTKSFRRKSAPGGDAGRYDEAVDISRSAIGMYYYRFTSAGNSGEEFVAVEKAPLEKWKLG